MKEPFKLTEGGVTNYAGSGNMINRIKFETNILNHLSIVSLSKIPK